MGEDKRMMTGECQQESASGIMWVGAFFSDNLFSKNMFLMRFNFSHYHGMVKGGEIICFVICRCRIYLYRDGNVQMGACRTEHADGSMPTGEGKRNGGKMVYYLFCCLFTD